MDLYQRLKKDAYNLDEAGFVRRHGGCYLFSRMPESQQGPIPFVTQVHSISPDGQLLTPQRLPATPERIWKVEKTERNSWKRRISVGRATNNDIVIRHDSVSKLHAHFSAAPPRAVTRRDTPSYLLTDAGASNGTVVNGTLLPAETATPIRNRDRIAFGRVSGQFLDASTLHSELKALDWE